MELAGTYTFEAPRDVVWQALFDPNVLAKVLPGCEKLEVVEENKYQGVLKIKVGPVQGKFQGVITLSDVEKPNSYRMMVDGKGAPGFMKANGEVKLEAQGDATVMQYDGTAQVGGRLASVGQRLLDSSAKALTRQSLDGLHKQVKARMRAEAAPAQVGAQVGVAAGGNGATTATVASPPTAPMMEEIEAPSELEFALGVAKNMLEDLVPSERIPSVVGVVLGVIGFFIFMNWWSSLIARKVAKRLKEDV